MKQRLVNYQFHAHLRSSLTAYDVYNDDNHLIVSVYVDRVTSNAPVQYWRRISELIEGCIEQLQLFDDLSF